MTSDITEQTLEQQLIQMILVYNGYTNIPASYD